MGNADPRLWIRKTTIIRDAEAVEDASAGAPPNSPPPGTADPALWRCTVLNELEIRAGLAELSPSVGRLTSLLNLNVSGNCITSLPAAIKMLSGLKVLVASGNALEELPGALSELSNLEVLDVSRNK